MFTPYLMPKSLGMIHTVNYSLGDTGGVGLIEGQEYLVDLPGQLTTQLQRMVRACGYFKVVGIDMNLAPVTGVAPLEPITLAGKISYYAPTRGRCEALKNAYQAVRNAMEVQGIKPWANRQYDFRVPMGITSGYVNGAAFLNAATFDGTNSLTLDTSAADVSDEIFTVYNRGIQPQQTAAVDFTTGFGIPGQPGVAPTDFVLNEGEYYEGSLIHTAETEKEFLPFVLGYGMDTATNTATVVDFEWRPDPALYLAVLTGQLEIEIKSLSIPLVNYRINTAVHVSGWKSVLGSKKKGRRHKGRRR